MGQTEAAASIEVVNRGISLSIVQAAHEDLPFSVGDTDRRLLLGGCGNVVDEAIKLEAAHLVKLVGPTVGGACDGERVGFAKEVDTANVIEVEALGRRAILRDHEHPHLCGGPAKGKQRQGQCHECLLHHSYTKVNILISVLIIQVWRRVTASVSLGFPTPFRTCCFLSRWRL